MLWSPVCPIDAFLSRCRGRWEGETNPWQPFSLAFSNPVHEARFLAERAVKLRYNVFYITLVALVMDGAYLMKKVRDRPHHLGKDAVFLHMFEEKVVGAVGGVLFLLMLLSRTPAMYNKLRPGMFESLWFWAMLFVMLAAITFSNKNNLTAMYGLDPQLVWGQRLCGDSNLLWGAGLASLMNSQPMGWTILSVFQVAGIACYAATSLLWGLPTQNDDEFNKWYGNVLGLILVAASMSIGKRVGEKTERRLFLELEKETSLRLDAQHDLLCSMCDALVRVDGEGRIQDADPTLAAILCLDSTAAGNLVNTPIQTFMQGDDGDRFTKYLAEAQEYPDRKESKAPLHLDLRDSLGGKLPVVLRCSCRRNKYGADNIIMGISETGPREREPIGWLSAPPSALNDALEDSDSASSSSRESVYNIDTTDMWVEFFAETYKIDEASPAYNTVTGAAGYEPTLFTDPLLHVSQFDAWFQALIQPIRDGVATTDILEETIVKMSLFPPGRALHKNYKKRVCRRYTYSVSLKVASCGCHWSPQLKMLARFDKAEYVPGQKLTDRGTRSCSSGGKFSRLTQTSL